MSFWSQLHKPFVALAPMAGVTDTAFRQLCKQGGADVVYTEFVSINAIVHESKKTFDMIKFQAVEQPVVVQIFGKEPKLYREAAKRIAALGFAGIDINFGCPAYKVVNSGGGVCLMRKPKQCAEIVAATIDGAGETPVSIKCRASINKIANKTEIDFQANENDGLNQNQNYSTEEIIDGVGKVTAVELLQAMSGLNLAAVMLHARSYEKPFDGIPDYDIYSRVRSIYSGILIANGGINTPEIAKDIFSQGQVDGLGIARGAWGQPWIFQQIKDYLHTGKYAVPDLNQIKFTMLEHARLALLEKGSHGLVELRKHLAWYVKGFPGAVELRKKLVQTKNLEEIHTILNDWKV